MHFRALLAISNTWFVLGIVGMKVGLIVNNSSEDAQGRMQSTRPIGTIDKRLFRHMIQIAKPKDFRFD